MIILKAIKLPPPNLLQLIERLIEIHQIKELDLLLADPPVILHRKTQSTLNQSELKECASLATETIAALEQTLACGPAAEVYLRITSRSAQATWIPTPAHFCSFCSGPISNREQHRQTGVCQRCGGFSNQGKHRVAWTSLHDLESHHFRPIRNGLPLDLKAGQVISFNAANRPDDEGPNGYDRKPRISLEVHAPFTVLPCLPANDQVAGLLLAAHTHFNKPQHAALRKREAFNTQWLLDLFQHSLPPVYPSARVASWRENFPDKEFIGAKIKTVSGAFNAWLDTSAPQSLLLGMAALFSPRHFTLTRKRCATNRCRREAIYATHLIFMMTDWLILPENLVWFGMCEKLLPYIGQAYDVLQPHKANEIELYIELAACLAVVTNNKEIMVETRDFINQHDWDKAVQEEIQRSATTRYAQDVELHMLFLRAWFLALVDQCLIN